MNPESWGFIGTLVGAIVGASASIFTTRISSANAIRVQDNIENNARKERSREFQRNNLLELQEKLSTGLRLANKAYIEDLENFRKTNKWRDSLISHELDVEIANCLRDLSIKTERIEDNSLREEIIDIRRDISGFLVERNFEIVEAKQYQITDKFLKVMPKLGKVLRENY